MTEMNALQLKHATNWRKSSRSKEQGDCVEIGSVPGVVGVRDTKDRNGGTLAFGPGQWDQFTTAICTGKFDL